MSILSSGLLVELDLAAFEASMVALIRPYRNGAIFRLAAPNPDAGSCTPTR
ncbi:hypothetical protein K6M89_16615 [Rhizobium sp. 13T]|uniref:Uncharacterized protein n=1 Tax=Rhizobium croatiense TaxID=2867516 RepID=A0ABS7M264_9HYPH|nr:hypothetical protein [Rhizobium croatiense]